MTAPFSHRLSKVRPPQIGLIILQADETIELDFRRLFPLDVELFVTRIPSGEEVTSETLAAMEDLLAEAAALFPRSARFSAVGYACTSGTAQIGARRVADLVQSVTETSVVTDPVSALVSACRAQGISRLGLLSPYVAEVSDRIRTTLAAEGIDTPVFGSFEVAEEARVARIDCASVTAAARAVAGEGGIDGVFLSCTNLRTLDVIPELEATLGLPVLSSNQVLAWELLRAAEASPNEAPGRLFATGP